MRKKYLSALLFGALLFASAGTFTSCKDYDDDINNLQEQINTINTTLSELKTLVGDGGVSSVTFDESTGVLTVVDANGTKTYTIKTAAGSVDEVKITIEGQELKVNGETVGKVGDTVAVANGELTINGTATGIKVGEYAILDNQTTGTVTITLPDADGKMQTVELMKASAALTAVEIENSYIARFNAFGGIWQSDNNSYDILWQKSQKSNPNWKGSKGAVEKNQLLIGQINYVNVQVTPATYALDEQALNLVDSRGNIAPVIVKATPNNRLMGASSRSTSSNGSWTLSLEIDQTKVNTSNIKSVFDLDKDDMTSLGYALYVNGQPYTTYDLSVNTASDEFTPMTDNGYINVTSGADMYFIDTDGREKTVWQAEADKLPVGTTNFYIKRADLYDFYLTFEKTNKSLAEQYGIEITEDGRGVIIPAGAEGVQITATVHTMSISGNVAPSNETAITNEVTLQIAGSEVTAETLKTTNHVISAANPLSAITVDFGDIFAQFPAAAREAVKNGDAVLVVESDATKDGFLMKTSTYDKGGFKSDDVIDMFTFNPVTNVSDHGNIELYDADKKQWFADKDDMLDLKYMALKVATNLNPNAVPGEYTLTFRAIEFDSNTTTYGNELIKVTVPVTVSTPKFTDLFNFRGNWNDAKTEYTTKITIDQDRDPALLLGTAFEKKAEGALTTRIQLMYDLVNNQSPFVGGTEIVTDGTKYITTNADQLMKLDKSVIYNGTTGLKNNNLGVKAYYDLFNAAGLAPEYDNFREAFAVTSDDLTVKLQKALEGITAAYYVNGAATNSVQLLTGNEILAGSGTVGKDANGLFFSFNGDDVAVKYTNWYKVDYDKDSKTYKSSYNGAVEIGGYNLALEANKFNGSSTPTNAGEISVTFVDEKNGLEYDWVGVANDYKSYSENVGVNQWTNNLGSTNVVIKFTDATGMTYQMSPITLIKAKN